MDALLDVLISKANYWVYIALMMIGLYGMIAKKNLVKKIIGMNILQTAVILFFISIGAKRNATIPIIEHGHDAAHTAVTASSLYQSAAPCADADRHRRGRRHAGCGLGVGDQDPSAVSHAGRKRNSGEDPGSMKHGI